MPLGTCTHHCASTTRIRRAGSFPVHPHVPLLRRACPREGVGEVQSQSWSTVSTQPSPRDGELRLADCDTARRRGAAVCSTSQTTAADCPAPVARYVWPSPPAAARQPPTP